MGRWEGIGLVTGMTLALRRLIALRPATAVSMLMRPAMSGTIRARQTKKERQSVTLRQWVGYVAVAAATTWLTKALDDLIDRRLGSG